MTKIKDFFVTEFQSWPDWFHQLSLWRKILPLASVLFYWLVLYLINGLKTDHLLIGLGLFILFYGGRKIKNGRIFLFPFILDGIIYDSQRFYALYIRGTVHVAEPYNFDKFFFAIQSKQGSLTPNEWFQLNTHPILDFITGFFYLTFMALFLLITGYFFFVKSKTGTTKYSSEELTKRVHQIMWAFLALNLIGFITYYLYPAAPPWYVSKFGLGPVNIHAAPDAAGCLRFDELLGIHVFKNMYSKSANVFGAIPSLHVAYPTLAAFYAFKFKSLRFTSLFIALIISFSAVYLNHHYILDVLWGASYAIFVGFLFTYWVDRKIKQALI